MKSTGADGDERRRARLAGVLERGQLVRVHRAFSGAARIEGYVIGVGTRWVLLAVVGSTGVLDGFTALRIADVYRVQSDFDSAVFVQRLLDGRGHLPPQPPAGPLNLDGTRRLIDSAAAAYPLITLFDEHRHPDECHVGVPVRQGGRRVTLTELSPSATWEQGSRSWARSGVSRIDVGGLYAHALFEVAGPPPATDALRRRADR